MIPTGARHSGGRSQTGLLAVVVLALGGCTALLDLDSLQQGGMDLAADGVMDIGRPDLGGCVQGTPCTVFTAQGECRRGRKSCGEAGVGLCVQTIQPIKEICDGKDSNCNGQADGVDPEADAACGAGKYCDGKTCVDGCTSDKDCTNGNTCDKTKTPGKCVCGTGGTCGSPRQCVKGACLCAGKFECAKGETCQAPGKCVCGATDNSAGPVCSAPNPECIDGSCRCDPDSICKAKETCATGACGCGKLSKPVGPFCPTGETCDPVAETCVAIPTDAGPDLPGPKDVGPEDVGPKDVGPKDVGPKDVGPKDVGPKDVAIDAQPDA